MSRTEAPGLGRAIASTALLLVAVVLLDSAGAYRSGMAGSYWVYALEQVFFFLPFGAALVVGQVRRVPVRTALMICLTTMLLMGMQDLAPPSDRTATKRALAFNPLDGVWAERSLVDLTRSSEGQSFSVLVAYASGALPEADDTAESYSEASPRLHVSYALWKLGYLLAPFAAIGAVLGSRAWVRRNLRARTRGAERTLLFVLAWVVGPATAALLAQATDVMRGAVIPAGYLPLILAVPAGFAFAAAFGWRAAAHQDALLDAADALPETD